MPHQIVGCDEEADYQYALTAATSASASASAGGVADAAPGRRLVVVQCNPSRAGHARFDPTVGKVATWAAAEGFAVVTLVNLFAHRSPHIEVLCDLPCDVLDYGLKRMGHRFDAAFLRNAVVQSPDVVQDRYGPWSYHRPRDAGQRELWSQIRLVPDRQRSAQTALRDATADCTHAAIAEWGARVQSLAERSRFGMNLEA